MSDYKQQLPAVATCFPRLVPTNPSQTLRYLSERSSCPEHVAIRAGPPEEKDLDSLPAGWVWQVQPEGQRYCWSDFAPYIVTDADITKADIQALIQRATVFACKQLEAQNILLTDSTELFIQPPREDDGDDVLCYYYFADHAKHAIWWLEEINTEDLLPAGVVSTSHLRSALEEQYWSHLEQFPSHRTDKLSLKADELISIFVHGENDQRTSTGSTFPYDAKQCKHFIRILQNAEYNLNLGSSVCTVARLWGTIARHRHQTLYGQERPRLDRGQRVLATVTEPQRGRIFVVASRALFGIPALYAKKLDASWCDGIVYVYYWREFMTDSLNEWKDHLTWSFGLSIINLLFFLAPGASPTLAAASLLLSGLAAAAAVALLARHQHKCIRSCDDAVPFLEWAAEDSNTRAALVWSLPRALFLWSVAVAGAQAPVWVERVLGVRLLGAVVAFIVLASLPWGRWTSAISTWREARGRHSADAAV